jgi:hypothetical protein
VRAFSGSLRFGSLCAMIWKEMLAHSSCMLVGVSQVRG